MKLSIVTGVCGNIEITRQWFDTTIENSSFDNIDKEIIVISNGNTPKEVEELKKLLEPFSHTLLREPNPLGSSRSLNIGAKVARGRILVFVHNDLMINKINWDKYLFRLFNANLNIGMLGIAGAKQLGVQGIYKKPYELIQLARAHVYTSLIDWQAHGLKCDKPVRVAVLDGIMMACLRVRFKAIGGFDEKMFHHQYDNDLSLRFTTNGFENYVVPIESQHISGQTASMPRYNDFIINNMGKTDLDVHKDSHEYFYKKWQNKLPVRV